MAKRQRNDKSRAEKIRAYRQHSRKNTSQSTFVNSATRKQTVRKVPVTRRTTSSIPMVKRQGRKVNLPLRTKGAEMQLPAFPQLKLGWRLFSGTIFILSLVVVFCFSSLDLFKISTIDLKGSNRLSADTILSQVNLIGETIIKIKPEEVEQKIIDAFPSLKFVKVNTGLPATINVQVIERDPIVLWITEASSLWIDAEGVTFPVRGEAETILSVMARGNPPQYEVPEDPKIAEDDTDSSPLQEQNYPQTSQEFVNGMLALREYLPEGTALQYDPRFGLGWEDSRGWLVYFGSDVSKIDIKLAEYEIIVESLQEENFSPALISLEFLHSPFYRMEP